MVYSQDDIKVSFMHIPKCGGAYIRTILTELYGFYSVQDIHPNYIDFINTQDNLNSPIIYDKHAISKYGKYRYFYTNTNVDRKLLEEYYTFTFVRNPYDRIYSAYNYLKKSVLSSTDGKSIRHLPEKLEYFKDFNTFIENKDNVNGISYFHAFITQFDQLLDTSNNIKISFIGRVETLDIDFMRILITLNLPINRIYIKMLSKKIRFNESITNNSIENEINDTSLAFINNYFKNDFGYFGYKKYDTIDELKRYYDLKKASLIHSNVTRITNLVNAYISANKIHFNSNKINNTALNRINAVNNILIENTLYNTINVTIREEVNNIKSELAVIRSDINPIVENLNDNINNLKQLLYSLIIEEQQQHINECSICKYKTYNTLATEIHKMLCRDTNIKK